MICTIICWKRNLKTKSHYQKLDKRKVCKISIWCQDERSLLHCYNYINHCKEFKLKSKSGRYYIWKYNHYFDCKSRDVVYHIIYINSEGIYIRETECLHKRMNKTKSSIRHANISYFPYLQNICRCKSLKEPLFKVYPFYYESAIMFRKFKEWRFIKSFKSTLMGKL